VLSDDDVRYIREQFVPLADLCDDVEAVRSRVAAGELPAPPYPGLELVPRDYLELPEAAAYPEEERASFLDGSYFVCLVHATPENVVRKSELVESLRVLLADPRPDEPSWRGRLRAEVDELDALERPFSPHYDRRRFGRAPTRDELIAAPRAAFPDVFQ
jgi:hypothetical protein